jgi:predicted acylesterase/phospholipase RssA
MKRILSIDGGGIRGIVPAVVLAEVEHRTQRPVSETFDLMAGTSTGGILALGLSAPGDDKKSKYAARQLVELYETKGSQIFHRDAWYRVWALENILEAKYPTEGIEEVLKEYFSEIPISQSLTELLVSSYDIERRKPFFFKRRKARESADFDWPMWQAARATSAAPTYFEPVKLDSPSGDDYFALIDGGVYANNPAMCAYAEARSIWPEETDFLVVSLGTGQLTRSIPYDQAKDWGLAKWAQPILGVVFDGVSDTVDYQLEDLCRDQATRVSGYYRFEVTLSSGNDDLDDASSTNVRALKLLAEDLVEQRKRDLDELCSHL